MASLNDRLRRLEEAGEARRPPSSTSRIADLERYCTLIEYVRQYGVDAPLPAHLLARDIEEEIACIEALRVSGSGWTENPEAVEFLARWEADLRGA